MRENPRITTPVISFTLLAICIVNGIGIDVLAFGHCRRG